jgi:hypothetical protein
MAAPPELPQVMQSTCHGRRKWGLASGEGGRGAGHGHWKYFRRAEHISGCRSSGPAILGARLQRARWHESCCVADVAQRTEADRIQLVVERDGLDTAIEWVRRTLQIYVQALDDPTNFARAAEYRPRFEESIRAFEAWLDQQDRGSRTSGAPDRSLRTAT